MQSLQGQFLIASRKLNDSNFFRTVVLLVQHREEGAMGLIVNRPLQTTVREAWEQVSDEACACQAPLHQGGPCEGPLMAIHNDDSLSELEIIPGVHFTTSRESIEDLVAQANGRSKFFIGYAGWSAGQLEAEIEEGSWLTAPVTLDQVYGDEDGWESLSKTVSRAAAYPWLDPKLIPDDPSVN